MSRIYPLRGSFRANRVRRPASRFRRMTLQKLEDRTVMTADAVPAYSSLPGADQTIYLDFNGHFQAGWNRTDVSQVQRYHNIRSESYNTDGQQRFNQSELDDIRAIWSIVAEDFAPFDVNVTTVEPTSFADNRALRVVIGGGQIAELQNRSNNTSFIRGNVFISDDTINPSSYSGYSSGGSFSNLEPNVVYVFANEIRSFRGDNENRLLNPNLAIASTASHEIGHAMGLSHHRGVNINGAADDYHIGDALTTPIMGNNLAHDRTKWSNSLFSGDNVAQLSRILGGRVDDHPDNPFTARPFLLNPAWSDSWGQRGMSGRVSGVIGTLTDEDAFSFSTSGGFASIAAIPIEHGNLDIRLDLYRWTTVVLGSTTTRVPLLTMTVDTNQFGGFWQQGLDARLDVALDAGRYVAVVRSHQSYGDLGQYSLSISILSNSTDGSTGWGGAYQLDSAASPAAAGGARPIAQAPTLEYSRTNTIFNNADNRYFNSSALVDSVSTRTAAASVTKKVDSKPNKPIGSIRTNLQATVDAVFSTWNS